MIFQTARLLVRPLKMEDFETFYLLNSDEEVVRYIRSPKSKEETFVFLNENIDYSFTNPDYGRWAIIEKTSQEQIGVFMLKPSSRYGRQIELGYSFLKSFWGKGFATESVDGALHYAFENLGLLQVIAIAQIENIASQKVLQKSGFVLSKTLEEEGRVLHLFIAKAASHDRNTPTNNLATNV
jgi:[ribosomal protein S5]-alanine N-acetyltransferase